MVSVLLARVASLGFILCMAVLYLLSKEKASPHTGAIGEYGFKLPYLAGIGFYVLEKLPWRFTSEYDGRVRAKIAQLYGHFKAEELFRVHLAQRIVMVVSVLFPLSLISLLGYTEFTFFVFGLVMAVLVYVWADREIDKKIAAQKRDILISLPEMLNNLALLVNAGLPLSAAINKIVKDKGNRGPLYKEMSTLLHDINAGKPVNQAYEDLARRCRIPEMTRFITVLLQNLNRGSDLVHTLRILAHEAWDKRKDVAKKQGEEASAKLVVPMVMVFIAVAIIVLAPAVITMS